MTINNFLDIAHTLADISVPIAQRYFRIISDTSFNIKHDHSPVTQADKAIERAIREYIMHHYPAHGIIGEEYGNHQSDAEHVWIIDPIDGTRAFTCGLPTFGTLIGLRHQDIMIGGILHQPISNERWVGAHNTQSMLNGTAIKTSTCKEISQARFATTSPFLFEDTQLPAIDRLRNATAIQSYGGDCYNYGLLSCGHIDLIVEAGLKPYDIMPLLPILQGAGAIISDWRGDTLDMHDNIINIVVSANQPLHQHVLQTIAYS